MGTAGQGGSQEERVSQLLSYSGSNPVVTCPQEEAQDAKPGADTGLAVLSAFAD